MHDDPEADFALDVGPSYRLTAHDTWSAVSSTGLGDALDGRQGVFRQSSDPPPQCIVGGAGRLPLDCCSALLAHHGRATYLVIQRAPHWNVAVLVPFALVTMLDVIGWEPYFRQ
jgi:hypothetical protein